MTLSFFISLFITLVAALLGMAFYTLLERKVLGYIQIRKGPNKVGLMGIPQPLADALKLFIKEQAKPSLANSAPFLFAPILSLILALTLWSLYPHSYPSYFMPLGILFFLSVSSLNVYSTLSAGWSSNSKYALLGAIRGVAQTISYEVSMALLLLSALVCLISMNLSYMEKFQWTWPAILMFPLSMMWLTTMLAETNRTPFDFAEGESELVSGFNIEYSAGSFALIFMAEYANIIIMSAISAALFLGASILPYMNDLIFSFKTLLIAFLFLWIRGSLPRMRYDRLMNLTWKGFLPFALATLIFITTITSLIL